MARHRWTILCRSAAVGENNSFNVTGIIDELHVGEVEPGAVEAGNVVVPTDLCFATLWWRSVRAQGETLQMRLVFIDPMGGLLGSTQERDVDLVNYIAARTVMRIDLWPLRGYGEYIVRVEERSSPNEEWRQVPGSDVIVFIGALPPGSVPPPGTDIPPAAR